MLMLKLLGVEVPKRVTIRDGLRLPHGAFGLVLHENTVLGTDVTLFQGSGTGRSDQWADVTSGTTGGVIIGHRVTVGAGAKIMFKSDETLTIGDGSMIGANAVVTADVPPGQIWAGLPARYVRDVPAGA